MAELALYTPTKKVSAWVAETDPKAARAWIEALPMADSAEAGRELFQGLYTLNRHELDAGTRAELLELYGPPVATVVRGLHQHLVRFALPLSPNRRQLAEFARQLHVEMATGYKCCLKDWDQRRRSFWGNKREQPTELIAGALRHLGEVLMRSYLVYLPYPAGVWREIHELFRYAEASGLHELPPSVGEGDSTTIAQHYQRLLLLGICNPYQFPQNDCLLIASFLARWAHRARLLRDLELRNPAGRFVVDLQGDGPPLPYARLRTLPAERELRLLDALELVRTVHGFISQLQKGAPAATLGLGFEALDPNCLDVLQRMMRQWALGVRRQHARIRRRAYVSVCAGREALHFFSDGRKRLEELNQALSSSNETPPNPPAIAASVEPDPSSAEAYIALDEPLAAARLFVPLPTAVYRIDRWQVRDVSPRGVLLAHPGDGAVQVRVGEIVGMQRADEHGQWSVAIARWMRSPQGAAVELGVEVLAQSLTAVAARPARGDGGASPDPFSPALLLPAMESLHRPATLLLARGTSQPGDDLELADESGGIRRVRVLKMLERAPSFELVAFADVVHDADR